MDFFESQELARRNTKWLVFLFALAVLAIIVAIFAVAVVVMAMVSKAEGPDLFAIATDWRLIAAVVAGVLSVIGVGTSTKMLELRNGGAAVASLMGGRRIVGNARAIADRRVSNVVEEMALASGTPVPPVYILDKEESINAFAAGYTVDDAVIGINRGTAEKLSRQELQGVVAHEFSHILNGDMRMSLRMVAILNGILLISIIGGQLLNFLSHTSRHTIRRSSDDGKGQAGFQAVLWIIAIGLYLIGSIGLVFGRMIKSMISKQREYLADASAVQFTRMPNGISGALKVIGGVAEGSKIRSANAEQISHMFFGAARSSFMFATHPPLIKRIRKIDERFDGDFKKFMTERHRRHQLLEKAREKDELEKEDKARKLMDMLPGSGRFGVLDNDKFRINPLILIAGIGIPTTEDVEYSGFMVNEIPADFLHAIRETFSARCVVFASLLNDDEASFDKQIEVIRNSEAKGSVEATLKVKSLYDKLPVHLRLGAFEIIQGTLSAMSPDQYPIFRKTVNDLIVADRQVDLFEFFLFHHLIVHLDRCFKPLPIKHNKIKSLEPLKQEIAQMISVLACVGQRTESNQQTVFNEAFVSLFGEGQHQSMFVPHWNHKNLSLALSRAATAVPMIKKQILTAAVKAISHDKVLTVQEVELFRAMSESLDCPVPPLVATRDEAPKLPDPEILS